MIAISLLMSLRIMVSSLAYPSWAWQVLLWSSLAFAQPLLTSLAMFNVSALPFFSGRLRPLLIIIHLPLSLVQMYQWQKLPLSGLIAWIHFRTFHLKSNAGPAASPLVLNAWVETAQEAYWARLSVALRIQMYLHSSVLSFVRISAIIMELGFDRWLTPSVVGSRFLNPFFLGNHLIGCMHRSQLEALLAD